MYEWDSRKSKLNRLRHGIWLSEAVGVFEDEMALHREDCTSVGERRFVATGLGFNGQLLTVVFTYRRQNVRLISARRAAPGERAAYEER